jgi:hypothetical protein
MSSLNFPCLIFEALYPNTKSNASIVLDFPDPLGPTIAENDFDDCKFTGTIGDKSQTLWKGPISCLPAYDLKFTKTIL